MDTESEMFSEHADSHHNHTRSSSRLNEWAKAAILIGLGIYFGYTNLSGNIDNYINERFGLLSYLATVLLLLLGVSALFGLTKGRLEGTTHRIPRIVMALVALPVILGTLVPSRPLGADAAQGNFNLSVASTYAGGTLPSNTADWNILDWIQAFYSDDDSGRLDGREANVIGFVVRDENFPPGYFMVARFFVSCCVADGTSVGLPVVWEGTGSLREDTWVRVRGNIEVGEFLGDTLPILYATTVDHTVGQPDRPYLYP